MASEVAVVKADGQGIVGASLIDTDVHPAGPPTYEGLLGYMPETWRLRLRHLANTPLAGTGSGFRQIHPALHFDRDDAKPPGGGRAASDPVFLCSDLLDRYGTTYALLIPLEPAVMGVSIMDPDLASVVVSACNDYFVEHWLNDRRLRYSIVVSPLDPLAAAAEIRRLGSNPSVAAVFVPVSAVPLGNARFNPIWEAALEYGLPVVSHPGAGEGIYFGNTAPFNYPSIDYAEKLTDIQAIAAANLTSLVFRGTFDRFPELKIVFVEWGFTWAVSHGWHMDSVWRAVRAQNPWVKRWPSEYIHDNVRFTSQPIPEPHHGGEIEGLIEAHFRDSLFFASDYPHWNGDDPRLVFKALSGSTRRKLFAENAASILRLT